MIYKFKSQAAADVIMQKRNGEQMLGIIGKEVTPQGIITLDQIPAAIAALEAAVVVYESAQSRRFLSSSTSTEGEAQGDGVMIRQRASPLLELLRCSAEAGKDIVWGV